MNIHFPTGGGAEIDGKKIGEKQLGGLVQELVRQGLLPHYAMEAAAQPRVRATLDRLGAAIEAKEQAQVLGAFVELLVALRDPFDLTASPAITDARVPTTDEVPGALRGAAKLLRDFPLATLSAFREPKEIEAQARRLEGQIGYEAKLSAEARLAQRNIVAGAQEADGWLRALWQLCQAAAPTTPGLEEQSAFLKTYFTEAAERAQVTRQLVDRVRNETTEEVKDAVYKQARTEARDELRDQLDERFRALLDK